MFKIKRKHIRIVAVTLFIMLLILIVVRKMYLENVDVKNNDFEDNEIFDLIKNDDSNNKDMVVLNDDKNNLDNSLKDGDSNEIDRIIIDIKGEVFYPGVYEIDKDTRIIDAINMAGGLTLSADTSNINLSSKIRDEDVIIIYSNNKDSEYYRDKNVDNMNNNFSVEDSDNNKNNDKKSNNNKDEIVLIDINTATSEELCSLPGIGEAKAKKIIEYRKKSKFNTIEDIMNVSSIGEKLFESIKAYIKV